MIFEFYRRQQTHAIHGGGITTTTRTSNNNNSFRFLFGPGRLRLGYIIIKFLMCTRSGPIIFLVNPDANRVV